jgi:hypothetical protein
MKLLLPLLVPLLLGAGVSSPPGVRLQQNGTTQGQVSTLNCTGSLTCTRSGSVGTLSASGGGAGGSEWADTSRRLIHCQPTTSSTTTFGCNGPTVPTVGGTPSAAPTATRAYLDFSTTTTNGNIAGITAVSTQTQARWLPRFFAQVAMPTTITSMRHWVGLSDTALGGSAVPAASSTITGADFVAVGYQAGVSGGEWMCCSGSNGTVGCTSTGVVAATSGEYAITIDMRTPGEATCTVNAASITRTTNLPQTAVGLGVQASVTTLTTGARNIRLSYWEISQQ